MLDIKDFYLITPMKRYEYMRIKITDIPEEIIKEYLQLRRAPRELPESSQSSQSKKMFNHNEDD